MQSNFILKCETFLFFSPVLLQLYDAVKVILMLKYIVDEQTTSPTHIVDS